MLAELVDAVIGVDTHRDTHEVEIALPTGTPIATITISNDSAGFAALLAWIFDHAPGPRLAVSIEGTRSYGAGLARAGPGAMRWKRKPWSLAASSSCLAAASSGLSALTAAARWGRRSRGAPGRRGMARNRTWRLGPQPRQDQHFSHLIPASPNTTIYPTRRCIEPVALRQARIFQLEVVNTVERC
jgi:hypothetical protein